MRIIAGLAKGCPLRSLRGAALRPTMDRVREAVFGVLATRIVGVRFLDLYAGAGTVGLEAVSRGAREAVFVESHRAAGAVILENATRCGLAAQVRVLVAPVPQALSRLRQRGERFELVFADPPYDRGEARAVMSRLAEWPQLLAEAGVLILQRSRHEEVGDEVGTLRRMKQGRFGETVVDYFQPGGEVE